MNKYLLLSISQQLLIAVLLKHLVPMVTLNLDQPSWAVLLVTLVMLDTISLVNQRQPVKLQEIGPVVLQSANVSQNDLQQPDWGAYANPFFYLQRWIVNNQTQPMTMVM